MSTDIQQSVPQKAVTLSELIASKRDAFAAVASQHYDAARLVKLGQAALARNPTLLKCTPSSVLIALMKCAELGLEPDSALPQRRMWLVPRWNSRLNSQECTYQIDYRAQLQLARDTGMVSSIVAAEVHEKDEWSYELSPAGASMTTFRFQPRVFMERGGVVGYFAAARLAGGEVQVVAFSRADAEAHRDRFAQKNRDGKLLGPWASDFDAMALKTCLRRLWTLLPAGSSAKAQKVQSAVAAEELDPVELDVAPPALEVQTKNLKERLAAKLERAVPEPDKTLEPGHDPVTIEGEPAEFAEGGR